MPCTIALGNGMLVLTVPYGRAPRAPWQVGGVAQAGKEVVGSLAERQREVMRRNEEKNVAY
jgi:hypothetical protein